MTERLIPEASTGKARALHFDSWVVGSGLTFTNARIGRDTDEGRRIPGRRGCEMNMWLETDRSGGG